MKVRHLHETDKQYRVFLYIFYAAASMMGIIMVYGVVMMVGEWQETGYYVMGEVLVNTHVPFDNFANLTTWLSFACVISWYCVSRIGWLNRMTQFKDKAGSDKEKASVGLYICLLYTSPSPRDKRQSRMPSSA